MSCVPSRYVWLPLVLTLVASSTAQAQTSEEKRAAARNLASDGLRAFQAGSDADAIDRFTRAEALVHAPPHLLYLARANARLGKLVQAKEHYVQIVREVLIPSAPAAFTEAQKSAVAEMPAIEKRIPFLTLVINGEPARAAKVTIDGVEVPSALVGVAAPANPGRHLVRATASGWEDVETTVELAEGAHETATLAFVTAKPTSTSPNGQEHPSRLKTFAPWIALGVGAVGLGVGTVFLLKNHGDRDRADEICGGGPCPSARRGDVESLDSGANTAATVAWIGYGVGAAGAIAGTTLLLMQRGPHRPTTGTTIVPWFGATAGGLKGWF